MTPTEIVSRLRRLANDWRKEEKQLCEQFGDDIIPHSMRARRLKDTKALEAAVDMVERMRDVEVMEKQKPVASVWRCDNNHIHGSCEQTLPMGAKLYALPGAQGE